MAPIQFIFGYSYLHNTYNLPQNTCARVNSTFLFFSSLINTLLSFCKNVDIIYKVSSNPPTPQTITLTCIACLYFVISGHIIHLGFWIVFVITKILLHGGSFHMFSCNFGQAEEYGLLYGQLHYIEVC